CDKPDMRICRLNVLCGHQKANIDQNQQDQEEGEQRDYSAPTLGDSLPDQYSAGSRYTQVIQREACHVAQQRDKSVGLKFCCKPAFFRGPARGVTDSAVGIEVGRDPSEGMRADRPQMRELLLDVCGL